MSSSQSKASGQGRPQRAYNGAVIHNTALLHTRRVCAAQAHTHTRSSSTEVDMQLPSSFTTSTHICIHLLAVLQCGRRRSEMRCGGAWRSTGWARGSKSGVCTRARMCVPVHPVHHTEHVCFVMRLESSYHQPQKTANSCSQAAAEPFLVILSDALLLPSPHAQCRKDPEFCCLE